MPPRLADGIPSVDHASLIREDGELAPILEVLHGERVAGWICGDLHLKALRNGEAPQLAQLGITLERGRGLRLSVVDPARDTDR